MHPYVVIAAGGTGSRMGSAKPKQYLQLSGQSVLWHSVNAFARALPQATIIVVLPETDFAQAHLITPSLSVPVQVACGGDSRFQSVKNGLALIQGKGVALVHDAARCLASTALIQRCYETAVTKGNAIPVVDVKDSLRRIHENGSQPVDRGLMKAVQTPQAFQTEYLHAFEQDYDAAFTDEATVLEAAGYVVNLVPGEDTNIKITVPVDLLIAEQVLRKGDVLV
jgi:2-C-methyl-D-erythritol 4-phosphate cytidylyltransferase